MSKPGNNCEVCAFGNPKTTVTAVIIKDGRLYCFSTDTGLDLPGGFVDKGETPIEALRRELKEELGLTKFNADQINFFPGMYHYNEKEIPVLAVAYLVEPLEDFSPKEPGIGFGYYNYINWDLMVHETDKQVALYCRQKFNYNWERVKELIAQLDPSAVIKEVNLYRSIIGGIFEPMIENGELVGMGWIFPRQTLLRKQGVVEDMIVEEKLRGQGRGEKILLPLLERAKAQGTEVAELTTNAKRISANTLYLKVGFWLHETNHYLKNL